LHALSYHDLNGDGRKDVLVRDWSQDDRGYIAILQNADDKWQQVDGWSQEGPDQKAGQALYVDLDGDGYAESIWKSRLGNVFLAWGGPGGFGWFYEPNNWLVHNLFFGTSFALIDIDHDGDLDGIWGSRYIDLNGTDGRPNADIDLWQLGDWTDRQKLKAVFSPLARHDLNGDGRLDAIVQQWWGDYSKRLVFLQQADGTFVLDSDTTHYPVRPHQGVFTALYCDGHVGSLQQTDLLDSMFRWSGE
jgi:prepilin-type processing-associated H-X9-DG protein